METTEERKAERTEIVPATQFLRPDGRRNEGGFYTTARIAKLGRELIDAGYRFEAEVLTNGQVHVDCCGPVIGNDEDGDGEDAADGEDGPIANFVCDNGPEVNTEFDALVERAHARIFGAKTSEPA